MVCLDESVVTASDMEAAMGLDNLRCHARKLRVRGINSTLSLDARPW